jgi:NAD(P)-dependent dehydrogenase (short-subunit alcohol dehydrogenase family)
MHHAVLPGMVARKAGRIINIASDAARVGSSGEAVYAACKGGLVSFTKAIAREHARHGITVNVVCPGPTDTALFFADYKEGAAIRISWSRPSSARSRSAASLSRTICRALSCSSPAKTRPLSPDRC